MQDEKIYNDLALRYDELKEDFSRLKQRAEQERMTCERSSFISFCNGFLLPLYDEMQRAWKNTASSDILHFIKKIEEELDKKDFIIMDLQFLEKLHEYAGYDVLENSVNVIQCFETDSPFKGVKDVFHVGLIDCSDNNKIVKYPEVTLYIHNHERR